MSSANWPKNVLVPSKLMVDIEGQSSSGGVSSTGFEQPVIGSAGRIVITAEFTVVGGVVSGNTLLAARAMKAHMRGRANTVLMPLYDGGNSPAAMAGENAEGEVLTFDDGTTFSDGTGIVQDPVPAQVVGDTPLGRGTILVQMLGGHTPQPGQWFGLKGSEAYLIDTATLYVEGLNYWTLTFAPTLRSATVDGEFADFTDPHVECSALNDKAFQIELQPPMYATPTLYLVEAPP